ncbi:MAG TPA: DUF4198 domain-containing protein [Thermoanaerobaculia bacterium]
MMQMCRSALTGALLFVSTSAFAHDFWLEPSTFRPAPGTNVAVRLLVGEHFRGEAVGRNDRKVIEFNARQGTAVTPLRGRHGSDPAGELTVSNPGLVVIGYRSRASDVELSGTKFEQYLREEGLERIAALRAQRGESDKPVRELFSRSAKALLRAGGEAKGFDVPLGYRLELVPESNPFGDARSLTVRVWFEGKPLEGTLVVAMHRDDERRHLQARSDAEGRVTFSLPREGVWLVKTTHMVAAPAGGDADWESVWASLIFERGR